MNYAFAFIIAYLLGSINSAILVGRLSRNIDIRKHGSGNAGATNVLRTIGKKAAILVLIVDVLKGIVGVLIGANIAGDNGMLLAGAGAIIGHNYPLYFGFKGGKGILTSAAVIFMLNWKMGIVLLIIALIIMTITRYVSLGSIIASAIYPIAVILIDRKSTTYAIFSIFVAILAIYRHKSNIIKLLSGTESKLGSKSKV
jgi:glycerol-3-phosphate acyltransferase PlsY